MWSRRAGHPVQPAITGSLQAAVLRRGSAGKTSSDPKRSSCALIAPSGSYIFGSLKWPQRLQGGWAKLGFLEPNRTIARPSKIFESLGPKDIGSFGGVSVENAIPARVNASRSNWTVAAASGTSGITIPQTKFTGYTLAEFTKSHWECGNPDKRLANCAARENDSASLAIHAKTSFPDCRDKDCVNDRDWSAVNSRHAVAFIIAAARSFAAAASFSSFAARSSAWEVCR